jgi:hypothetical protein
MEISTPDHLELIVPTLKWATFWITMNLCVLPRICSEVESLRDWYKKQAAGEQIEFCGCIIAGIHGSFAAGSSIIAILFDKNLSYTDLYGHSTLLEWQFKMSIGYFISDTVQMLKQGKSCKLRNEFILHHIICGIAIYLAMRSQCCYYFIGFKMMTELSTPFMNISLLMEMTECKKSLTYFINGHLFYWTFFLVRPMLIPSYWSRVGEQIQADNISTMPTYLLIINIVLSLTIEVLNIIWTVFVSKDYYRRLKVQYKEKKN